MSKRGDVNNKVCGAASLMANVNLRDVKVCFIGASHYDKRVATWSGLC